MPSVQPVQVSLAADNTVAAFRATVAAALAAPLGGRGFRLTDTEADLDTDASLCDLRNGARPLPPPPRPLSPRALTISRCKSALLRTRTGSTPGHWRHRLHHARLLLCVDSYTRAALSAHAPQRQPDSSSSSNRHVGATRAAPRAPRRRNCPRHPRWRLSHTWQQRPPPLCSCGRRRRRCGRGGGAAAWPHFGAYRIHAAPQDNHTCGRLRVLCGAGACVRGRACVLVALGCEWARVKGCIARLMCVCM
jgi:hypothetical protein